MYNPYNSACYSMQPNNSACYSIPQTQDERIWVQNQTSAEAYLVAPNGFVRLWDSNAPVFYEKRADASGRPYPLDVYEYKRRTPKSAINAEEAINVYQEKIEALDGRITQLEREVKNVQQSNYDDSTIQSIQKSFHRQSGGGSKEASFYGENVAGTTEPITNNGNRISENDERF